MADSDPFSELPTVPSAPTDLPGTLDVGAFSISLTVADLAASQAFYEHLGFVVTGGDPEQNWLILKNGDTTIGLFHGMFEHNVLTFNPGLTSRMERVESFTDVRDIQARLEAAGVEVLQRADPDDEGPASFLVLDPDDNPVLVDQFFPRPA